MDVDRLATAHERWDDAWRSPDERADWLAPEPSVVASVPALLHAGARRVLDVGCGVGRHTGVFTDAGLITAALDGSPAGVAETVAAAPEAMAAVGTFTALPYADVTFDHVLAWNVVYHGDADVTSRALAEVARVLRADGSFRSTMLSKRNDACGRGVEVRPDTWVDADDPGDKAHPHLFVDRDGLVALHEPWFDVVELVEAEQRRPGAWHWEAVWVRRGRR
jgi:SAM-dependent methyltransferase